MTELWVYAELHHGAVHPVTLELLGKASGLAAQCGGRVTAVALAADCDTQALVAAGADTVLLGEGLPDPAEEGLQAEALAELCRRHRPDMLLLGATGSGRSLAPRTAALLRTGLTADCTHLALDENGLLLQTRPAFGGNLMATILCPERRPQMATVRPKVFPLPAYDASRSGEVCREALPTLHSSVRLLEELTSPGGDARLDADILVAVGNGIGSDENLEMARELARRLNAGLAATRPLVDAGRMPYPHQVGQTGKTVAPKMYLALGISGAIQHLAGVQAERLIAVNADPDAPIFAQADEAVVADCGAFLRALLTLVPCKG